ncbi:MAG: hypothetical protein ACRBBW_21685 [Cellvibrionaceae bacterium]
MNKEEALWVVVRAAGMIFLVLAIISFGKILSSISYFIYAADVISEASGSQVAEKTAKSLLSKSIGDSFLYALAAYYFMRRGKLVHVALSK